MRRQRHSSPSPAQAANQAPEEDGNATAAKWAGTDSPTDSDTGPNHRRETLHFLHRSFTRFRISALELPQSTGVDVHLRSFTL